VSETEPEGRVGSGSGTGIDSAAVSGRSAVADVETLEPQVGRLEWRRILIGMGLGVAVAALAVWLLAPHLAADVRTTSLAVQQPLGLLVAVLCVGVYLYADACSLVVLVRVMKQDAAWLSVAGLALESHLVGGATSFGGLEVPYQVVFLRGQGLSVPEATSAVVFKGIVRGTVLVAVALAALLPGVHSPLSQTQRLIVLAVAAVVALVWLASWLSARRLAARERAAQPLARSVLPAGLRRRLSAARQAVALLHGAGWRLWLRLVFWQALYWTAMFAIIPLIFFALGYSISVPEAVVGQAVLQLLMVLSPLPGGAGVAEVGYLALIGTGVPMGARVASLVLWRALTWLVPVGSGALALGVRSARRRA